MPHPDCVICGQIVTPHRVLLEGWITLRDGLVESVGDGRPPAVGRVVDTEGCVVTPGFVDVHVHGGGGAQIAGSDPETVAEGAAATARFHATRGTTCLLATTVSDSEEGLRVALAGIDLAMAEPQPGAATIGGAHLEGPFLAPSRKGAHDPALLRIPDAGELLRLLGSDGVVRLVTLAPELPGAAEAISAARLAGVTVSVGHTDATFAQTVAAFDAGARHVTHLGNAMPALDRREPGPFGAALVDPRVTVEVIADGLHVHPSVLALVAEVAGDRLVAVTDATAAAGMPDGTYELGAQEVEVSGGRVSLKGRPETLAGSALTMDRALATLVGAGVPLTAAVRAVTATPQRLVGLVGSGAPRGELAPGFAGDVVVLDDSLTALATLIGGRVVSDRTGLFA